jgi:hypothetical protein
MIKSTKRVIQVRGKSLIDHKKRKKLDLSLPEYVFLDAIEQLIIRKNSFNSKLMFEDFYRICGIDRKEYIELGKSLKSKGMLIPVKEYVYKIYDKWYTESDDLLGEFEVIWELLQKVGNKKKSLEMYIRARKAGFDYQHLLERSKLYMKFIKESNQYIMHVSTFFNPDNEEFNNEFKVINQKQKDIKNAIKTIYEGKF